MPYRMTFILLTCVTILQACTSKTVIIKPRYPYRNESPKVDKELRPTGENVVSRYFFVEHWNPRDSSKVRQLRAFALSHADANYAQYPQYEMHFFNKTSELNEKLDSASYKLGEYHQDDLAATVRWLRGNMFFNTFEDGKCVDCYPAVKQ